MHNPGSQRNFMFHYSNCSLAFRAVHTSAFLFKICGEDFVQTAAHNSLGSHSYSISE
jgi:hypothetical protein